ncbi:MAG: hypothetical protein KF843_02180 [Flavobacteriales bacterium]|nr:hypothetical protein [Flavobacteriales bacterium]
MNGRRHIAVLCFLALITNSGQAQAVFRSFNSSLHVKATWNGLPVLATTDEARVIIDYEKATLDITFDPAALRTGVPELDSILVQHHGLPVSIMAKLVGVDHIQTVKHPPMDFDLEGRLAHMDFDAPIMGKGHLEHIFAGLYACLLDVTFNVPVERFQLDRTFPGLSGDITLHIVQSLLKRAND